MSEKTTAPKFKVVEIGRSDFGRETTDYLIAEDHVQAKDVMLGVAPAIAQVADRLTADIIVKSLNGYPDLLDALQFYAKPEIYKPHPHGLAFDNRDLSFHARAALAKAEGRE